MWRRAMVAILLALAVFLPAPASADPGCPWWWVYMPALGAPALHLAEDHSDHSFVYLPSILRPAGCRWGC